MSVSQPYSETSSAFPSNSQALSLIHSRSQTPFKKWRNLLAILKHSNPINSNDSYPLCHLRQLHIFFLQCSQLSSNAYMYVCSRPCLYPWTFFRLKNMFNSLKGQMWNHYWFITWNFKPLKNFELLFMLFNEFFSKDDAELTFRAQETLQI